MPRGQQHDLCLGQRIDLLVQEERRLFGSIVQLQTEVVEQFCLITIQIGLYDVRRVELVHVSVDRVHFVDFVVVIGVWALVDSKQLQWLARLDVHVFRQRNEFERDYFGSRE